MTPEPILAAMLGGWEIVLILAIVVHAVFALVKTLLFLPARVLGYRSAS